MLIEVADERPTPCRRRFVGGDARACDPEAREEGLVDPFEEGRAVTLLGECEGREVVAADVLCDGVCRARRAARSTKRPLGAAEEALELVRGWRHARVVEAHEEMLLVALDQRCEVFDEVACRSAETVARGLGAQLRDVGIEARLGFGGVLGAIVSLGVGRDLVRDFAQDRCVPLYAPGESDLVPVGSEGSREVFEEGSIIMAMRGPAPPFKSRSTSSRSFSSRS